MPTADPMGNPERRWTNHRLAHRPGAAPTDGTRSLWSGRSIGIDLAASPAPTAVAVLHWDGSGATAGPPRLRCTDDDLLGLLTGLRPGERAGGDCPIGRPIPFVQAIAARARRQAWPGRGATSAEHRPSLRHRRTDAAVRQALAPHLQPLSRSAPTTRSKACRPPCAARWGRPGRPVTRGEASPGQRADGPS